MADSGKVNGTLPGLPPDPKTQWTPHYEMRPDLMPCPFCGLPPSSVVWDHPQWARKFQIICAHKQCSCLASTQRMPTFEKAVHAWANRPKIEEVRIENDVRLLAGLDDDQFSNA